MTQTQCSVFFDQRVGKSDSPYDTLLEVPLDVKLSGGQAYAVHVNVNSRFLESQHADGALVGSDLVVALTDGQRVLGFVRTSPMSADATGAATGSWGSSLSGSYAARALPSAGVSVGGGVARCDANDAGCTRAASENFEVVFALGARTSVVGRTTLGGAVGNAAGGVEFSEDLRFGTLRLVVYATASEHAYELGAIDVRVSRLERDQSLTQFASAAEFVAQSTSERFSSLWHAQLLGNTDDAAALFAADRQHSLIKDGCGVAFRATPALPGVAFGNLVALPLLGAQALRRDRQYVVHVSVAADTNTPRNQLLIGVADGLETGSHVVGFARGDRSTAPVLGGAFGGLLTRNGDSLYIESGQFVTRDSGVAGSVMSRRFEFDVVVGSGSTRIVSSAQVIKKFFLKKKQPNKQTNK